MYTEKMQKKIHINGNVANFLAVLFIRYDVTKIFWPDIYTLKQ